MSREIKFRAWDKERKRMETCVGVNPFYICDCDRRIWKPEQVELMQFTGLKDKNRVDIYEGDLVKTFNGEVGEVQYGEYQERDIVDSDDRYYIDADVDERFAVGFHVRHKSGSCNSLDNMTYKWVEVIGNKWENSELMEGCK